MSVKIRLSRIGKKHVPFYRLVAVDSRKKRDGEFLANIGTYDALKTQIVQFHEGLYDEWLSKGALPSDAVKRIYHLYKRSQKQGEKPSKPVKKVAKKVEVTEKVKEAETATESKA